MKPALIVVDHGSSLPESNEVLKKVTRLLQQRCPELLVHYAHLSLCSPCLPEAIARCTKYGALEIVVFPYMLLPGRHACRDIPDLVESARRQYPDVHFTVCPPLGVAEGIVNLILEQALKTRSSNPSVPTWRSSNLSANSDSF